MTKQELSQLFYLKREITQKKERLAELEAMAMGTSVRLTGMPHGESLGRINQYGPEIADLRALIDLDLKKCWYELNRLNRYIAAIPDSHIRQIFTLRHVNGLTWRQVANQIGGGNTEDGVRMIHDRYLAKN